MWVVLRVIDTFKKVPHVSVMSVHLSEAEAQKAAGRDVEHRVVKIG